MLNITEEFKKLKLKTDKLEQTMKKFNKLVSAGLIAVGKNVYEQGMFLDYFKMEILKIDIKNCQLKVKDMSFENKETKIIQDFYFYDDASDKFINIENI